MKKLFSHMNDQYEYVYHINEESYDEYEALFNRKKELSEEEIIKSQEELDKTMDILNKITEYQCKVMDDPSYSMPIYDSQFFYYVNNDDVETKYCTGEKTGYIGYFNPDSGREVYIDYLGKAAEEAFYSLIVIMEYWHSGNYIDESEAMYLDEFFNKYPNEMLINNEYLLRDFCRVNIWLKNIYKGLGFIPDQIIDCYLDSLNNSYHDFDRDKNEWKYSPEDMAIYLAEKEKIKSI